VVAPPPVGTALLSQLGDIGPRLAAQGDPGIELRLAGWSLAPGWRGIRPALGRSPREGARRREPVDWERLLDT